MRRKTGTVIPMTPPNAVSGGGRTSRRSGKASRNRARKNRPAGSRSEQGNHEQEEFLALDLADSPGRPLFQRLAYPPRVSLNAILVGLLCVLLLTMLGFVPLSLPVPLQWGTVDKGQAVMLMHYTLQLPMALFISAFLGPFTGVAAVGLYVLIGLTLAPIFANGGGWLYALQPGFGYWLGILTASILLSRSFYRAFQKEEGGSRSLKLLRQIFGSVLTVHAVGVVYLIGLVLTRQIPPADLPGWTLRLTLEPLPYDLLAVAVLLCLVRQMRLALWMVLY